MMWFAFLALVLVGAQMNVSWLVPLKTGDPQPPWWVGGRVLWPYAEQTRSLIPMEGFTPLLLLILGTGAGLCFLLAAAALLRLWVPEAWLPWLLVIGASMSALLQVLSFNVWSLPPLAVDAAVLWVVFSGRLPEVMALVPHFPWKG